MTSDGKEVCRRVSVQWRLFVCDPRVSSQNVECKLMLLSLGHRKIRYLKEEGKAGSCEKEDKMSDERGE